MFTPAKSKAKMVRVTCLRTYKLYCPCAAATNARLKTPSISHFLLTLPLAVLVSLYLHSLSSFSLHLLNTAYPIHSHSHSHSNNHSSAHSIDALQHRYHATFHRLGLSPIPSRSDLPRIDWNVTHLSRTPRHSVVEIGVKHREHIAIYNSLCLHTSTQQFFTFQSPPHFLPSCYAYHNFQHHPLRSPQHCLHAHASAHKETLLPISSSPLLTDHNRTAEQWIRDHENSVRWIAGVSVLQVLDISCGNIAHYAGKILMLQHILDNFNIYSGSHTQPPHHVLILPVPKLMRRFTNPADYNFYHSHLLSAILSPFNFSIASFSQFLASLSTPSSSVKQHLIPNVHLLHNLSLPNTHDTHTQYVCFEKAVVPGLLKGRFFINDEEYPSQRPSMRQTPSTHTLQTTDTNPNPNTDIIIPSLPRDALRFKQRIYDFINASVSEISRKRHILFIDRRGSRRVFDAASRNLLLDMVRSVATNASYELNVSTFDDLSFTEQVRMMKQVGIAIGIHGANLVNTIFMPPLSVLVEIFPFGFKHTMYEHAGNSGIVYMSHTMTSGEPFHDLRHYTSVQQCIQADHECKVHYRDLTMHATESDLEIMQHILRKAIHWHESLLS